MKLKELPKREPPYSDIRREISTAMEAGKISEETDVPTALRQVGDPHYALVLTMIIKKRGKEFVFPVGDVRGLIWLLERLDRQYERKRKKEILD